MAEGAQLRKPQSRNKQIRREAMAIRFECPHCKNGVKVPEGSTGRKAVRPLCRNERIIPEKKVVNVPEGDTDVFEQEVQESLDTPDAQGSDSNKAQGEGEEIGVAA
jgi:hypothetical protein